MYAPFMDFLPVKVYISFDDSLPQQVKLFQNEKNIYINLKNTIDYQKYLDKIAKKLEFQVFHLKDIRDSILNNSYDLELNFAENNNKKCGDFINKYKERINYYNFGNLKADTIVKVLSKFNIPNDAKCTYYYDNYSEISKNVTSSKENLVNAAKYILKIKKYVERFNFSNLEKCIFIYDLVREREYHKAEGTNLTDSRSLTKIYDSNDIVCVGYANLYAALLNEFDIENEVIMLNSIVPNKCGHASNNIILRDEKYDRFGQYITDVTYDSKTASAKRWILKNNSFVYKLFFNSDINIYKKGWRKYNVLYLKDYDYLLRPFNSMNNEYEENNLKISATLNYSHSEDEQFWAQKEYSNLIEVINNQPEEFLKVKCKSLLEKIIKDFYYLFKKKTMTELKEMYTNFEKYDIKKIINKLDTILIRIMNKENDQEDIYISDFVVALYNVRRVEASINYKKYKFSLKEIREIINNRYSIKLTDDVIAKSLVEYKNLKNTDIDDVKLDAARMKLISTLHKVAKDGVYNNPALVKEKAGK